MSTKHDSDVCRERDSHFVSGDRQLAEDQGAVGGRLLDGVALQVEVLQYGQLRDVVHLSDLEEEV